MKPPTVPNKAQVLLRQVQPREAGERGGDQGAEKPRSGCSASLAWLYCVFSFIYISLSLSIYIYILAIYIYITIYIYIEREREKELCIYIYIYTYSCLGLSEGSWEGTCERNSAASVRSERTTRKSRSGEALVWIQRCTHRGAYCAFRLSTSIKRLLIACLGLATACTQ